MAEELEGFEQLFHQYLLDRKAAASTVTWDKIQSLPESAVSGGDGRGGEEGDGRGGDEGDGRGGEGRGGEGRGWDGMGWDGRGEDGRGRKGGEEREL